MITAINLNQLKQKNNKIENSNQKENVAKDVKCICTKNVTIPKNLSAIYFTGNIHNEINSARKWIDYGDIFKQGSIFTRGQFPRAKKFNINLIDSILEKTNFSKSSFRNAQFNRAILKGESDSKTDFSGANLYNAIFIGAKIKHTSFMSANLARAKFNDVEFGIGTNMQKANLLGADFRRSDISNVNFINSLYDETTKFPKEFDPKQESMIEIKDGADYYLSSDSKAFEQVKLRYQVLRDSNFNNMSLKRIDLKGADILNCKMQNTDLTRAYMKKATLKNLDLTGNQLKQANLDGARLDNVNLESTNLRGAVLTWDTAKDIKLTGAVYDQYTLFNSGFDPKMHGMILKASNPDYYGIK